MVAHFQITTSRKNLRCRWFHVFVVVVKKIKPNFKSNQLENKSNKEKFTRDSSTSPTLEIDLTPSPPPFHIEKPHMADRHIEDSEAWDTSENDDSNDHDHQQQKSHQFEDNFSSQIFSSQILRGTQISLFLPKFYEGPK